ncbi:cytochrome oxidase complex assembly protein [Diplodia corticola]|uniref:Cytochrome oxidase complex assembly protein n=1 Tax=Diplodia corticola TaxID=236234 RepID=A0A1J9QRF6_9PEZI|nr:cytochrome oxidase complex assembly protein [Diplodia corticola]OJD31032.1 cytochrome oxidase complex assembly protein [Diplodia corticola]
MALRPPPPGAFRPLLRPKATPRLPTTTTTTTTTPHLPLLARRTLIAAPKPNSGPLMTRRADRALPSVSSTHSSTRRWLLTLPAFGLVLAGATAAIFNYQKQSSSVVEATLYALRTHPDARAALGGEIRFASAVPWIAGTIDQLHGRIDVRYGVRGREGKGVMRFRSERRGRMGFFETLEWSLTTDDGKTIQLLDQNGPDPFRRVAGDDED